eukprot:362716-Chlamydomonas_euryale.AAC.1
MSQHNKYQEQAPDCWLGKLRTAAAAVWHRCVAKASARTSVSMRAPSHTRLPSCGAHGLARVRVTRAPAAAHRAPRGARHRAAARSAAAAAAAPPATTRRRR